MFSKYISRAMPGVMQILNSFSSTDGVGEFGPKLHWAEMKSNLWFISNKTWIKLMLEEYRRFLIS